MGIMKNAFVAASLLAVIMSMTVFIPSQAGMATFTVSAAGMEQEGFYKLLFGLSNAEGSYSQELYVDDFSGGISVPIGTQLVSIVCYANVSAARYTANPALNTWMNLTVLYPTSLTAYNGNFKVDACYAYDADGTFLGTGYQEGASYYNVIRTFYIMKTLTEGVWIVSGSLYLL